MVFLVVLSFVFFLGGVWGSNSGTYSEQNFPVQGSNCWSCSGFFIWSYYSGSLLLEEHVLMISLCGGVKLFTAAPIFSFIFFLFFFLSPPF